MAKYMIEIPLTTKEIGNVLNGGNNPNLQGGFGLTNAQIDELMQKPKFRQRLRADIKSLWAESDMEGAAEAFGDVIPRKMMDKRQAAAEAAEAKKWLSFGKRVLR